MSTAAQTPGRRLPVWLRWVLILVAAGAMTFALLLSLVLRGSYDHIGAQPDVMVILGCKVEADGSPSMLLKDRLDEALDYLESHPNLPVVVSGGQGANEPVSEAECMAAYLIKNGIPAQTIWLEDQSHNTVQNFAFTRELLERQGLTPENELLVVSNGFHLTRSRMLADRAGFDHVATLAAPSSHLPSRIRMYVREPLALVKSFFLDHL